MKKETDPRRRRPDAPHGAPPDVRLDATPALDGLLTALRRRLHRKVWLHGIGTILVAAVLWTGFAFLADWGLRVPLVVRLFHGGVLLGLVAFFVWRSLLRPLVRIPTRHGLAVLVERVHPDLRQLLTSAVDFQRREASSPAGDPQLVGLVLEQSEDRARDLSLEGVLDERSPRNRFLLGTCASLIAGLLAALFPGHASIFFNRLLGGGTPWPQRTHLVLDVLDLSPGARVERTPDLIRVRLARGSDVPVLVVAEGEVPSEVTLHFQGGRDVVLAPSAGGAFRTLLRAMQEDAAFHATGGDDRDGKPRVEIEVLQPPDVEGLAVRVEPPAYSGLPESLHFDQDVDVLAGSRVTAHILPFPREARGIARILPDDAVLELEPAPYPVTEDALPAAGAEELGLSFSLYAEKSIGYRLELTDSTGLSNPDPGLFRVRVVEDRPPEVVVLSPSRSEFEIVRGGAIPLRARAEDDFGVESLSFAVRRASGDSDPDAAPLVEGSLSLREVPRDPALAASRDRRRAAWGGVRIEVNSLEEEVSVDQWYELLLTATDNRVPLAGEGRALPVRARVVTPEELLRRMQSRLAQAKLAAVRLSDLQREKRARVEELLSTLEGDGSLAAGEGLALSAATSGQRRVLGDAEALARNLAEVVEDILYARLDQKAEALLEFYDARAAEHADLRFHSAPFRELASAQRAGQLGPSGFAGNLVQLLDLALAIGEDHAAGAAESLDRASTVLAASDLRAALLEAADRQAACIREIDALLDLLAEWDNFQNILALTRDILNGQKALRERTQGLAEDLAPGTAPRTAPGETEKR